ncbi:hypothetical protein U9M48_021201 [Paspalum notatum var. saurae]|uniref:Uncharacterized protein n=1 Tax=Paspalum notatum var. saurae TaxID=547442 RepID=A0AAQ3TG93_PASNO
MHVRVVLEACKSRKKTVMTILKMKENKLYKRWWSTRNKTNSGEKMTSNAEIVKSVYFYVQRV